MARLRTTADDGHDALLTTDAPRRKHSGTRAWSQHDDTFAITADGECSRERLRDAPSPTRERGVTVDEITTCSHRRLPRLPTLRSAS
jgi:hypothetical protein